ncbi:MAG: polyamine aminopropyltransferase [Gammaproteobacteria bacterium]|nr:polyamine aminopropyltransferase [Gammaproteobacteria bacterium]
MTDPRLRLQHLTLLFATFVVAICGLVYELLIGTLSSYLMGDSVFEFSLVIGLFMTAMGLGSWLSRHAQLELARWFVGIQFGIGLLGGLAPLILFFAFAQLDNYRPFLLLIITALGTLTGMEIPLVIRLLEHMRELRVNLSNVLSLDYGGALVASLLFPLVLAPQLGLLRTGLLFGLLNLWVALLAVWVFRDQLARWGRWLGALLLSMALLAGLFVLAERLTQSMETRLYDDEIVYAETSPYQRLVLTRDGARIRFFLNGGLQFDSLDEYRYHESLVHPALALAERRERLLILGGGDGLALREVLRWGDIGQVDLVDLDPAVTGLFSRNPLLRQLNGDSLSDPRVRVHNADAWKFLEQADALYDAILIDLPDPRSLSLSRLYSESFYKLAAKRLARGGVLVTQATSPLYARQAFWSIVASLQQGSGLDVLGYHAYVPSFGEWGFALASAKHLQLQDLKLPAGLRFLHNDLLAAMTQFPADMAPLPVESNRLSNHILTRYYEEGWANWFR